VLAGSLAACATRPCTDELYKKGQCEVECTQELFDQGACHPRQNVAEAAALPASAAPAGLPCVPTQFRANICVASCTPGRHLQMLCVGTGTNTDDVPKSSN
jgi:hypothetical protein